MILVTFEKEEVETLGDLINFSIGNCEEEEFDILDDGAIIMTSSNSYCHRIEGQVYYHQLMADMEGWLTFYKDNSVNFWGRCTPENIGLMVKILKYYEYQDEVTHIEKFINDYKQPYNYVDIFIGCGSHCFEEGEWEERERTGATAASIINRRLKKEPGEDEYFLMSSKPI